MFMCVLIQRIKLLTVIISSVVVVLDGSVGKSVIADNPSS